MSLHTLRAEDEYRECPCLLPVTICPDCRNTGMAGDKDAAKVIETWYCRTVGRIAWKYWLPESGSTDTFGPFDTHNEALTAARTALGEQ